MKATANSSSIKSKEKPTFNVQAFLDSAGVARKIAAFRRKETIFSQGDSSKHVMYVQKGSVKLSVINEIGKEAVVAILGPGDFFGRGMPSRADELYGDSHRDYSHDSTSH